MSAYDLQVSDVKSVNEATALAINCKTDEAVAAVDRAIHSDGLGAAIGGLDWVVILHDDKHIQKAEAAMAERNKRRNADTENKAKAEKAVKETVKKMRD